MELQWLILFPGKPSTGDWRRFDAAARIVRAALSYKNICHMVFGDRTRISLQAEFMDIWTGTEAHYCELIQAIAKGQMYKGAFHQPYNSGMTSSDSLSAMVHEMLQTADVVLDFREDGSMVIGRFDDAQTPSAHSALCVIGGVRDIEPREHAVLNELCQKLKKPQLSVSLGIRAELTSKCVKAVGEMNRSTHFGKAVSTLLQSRVPAPPPQPQSRRPNLHLIVIVPNGMTVTEFIERPGTPTMVVDAFIHSHGIYSNTSLSILTKISTRGDAVTVQAPAKCLAEVDATEYLKDRLQRKREQNLEETLREGKHGSQISLQRALVVDEQRPPLQMMGDAAAQGKEVPVVVIFTNNSEEREAALNALLAVGVSFHMVAAMGGIASGLAYANVLHNSGLLGPALVASLARRPAPKALPSCPTVSLSSRVPAHMRPKGGGRLAPWAKKAEDEACASTESNVPSTSATNSQGDQGNVDAADAVAAATDVTEADAAAPTCTPTPSDTDPPDDAASSGETR